MSKKTEFFRVQVIGNSYMITIPAKTSRNFKIEKGTILKMEERVNGIFYRILTPQEKALLLNGDEKVGKF